MILTYSSIVSILAHLLLYPVKTMMAVIKEMTLLAE